MSAAASLCLVAVMAVGAVMAAIIAVAVTDWLSQHASSGEESER